MNDNTASYFIKSFGRYKEYYASNPNTPGEYGGFLIPERIDIYADGIIASYWRKTGKLFRREDWYRRGIITSYPAQELREMLKRLKYEK